MFKCSDVPMFKVQPDGDWCTLLTHYLDCNGTDADHNSDGDIDADLYFDADTNADQNFDTNADQGSIMTWF